METKTSTSRKSASTSNPVRKFYRRLALKRDPTFREIEDADLKWIYAAYKKKAFDGLIQKDLNAAQFRDEIIGHLAHVHEAWILRQEIPMGLVVALVKDNRLEPHVFWFPWASARNKIEGTIKFLNVMRKAWTCLVYAEEKNHKFFKHIEKYGVIRQVGKIHKYFPNGETASMFQTRDLD